MTQTEAVLHDVELYLDLYRRMRLIRGFEDLVQSLFLRGEIYGTTHLYSGQEAVAVGFASMLGERDRVAATYRGHGHALALGVERRLGLQRIGHPSLSARYSQSRSKRYECLSGGAGAEVSSHFTDPLCVS